MSPEQEILCQETTSAAIPGFLDLIAKFEDEELLV